MPDTPGADLGNLFAVHASLSAADAAAAILITPDERYLVQLRDDIPDIFFPGHWGCFGGAMDPQDANPGATLVRELHEELGLSVGSYREFNRIDLDLTRIGGRPVFRIYYEVEIASERLPSLRLGEGQAMAALTAEQLFDGRPIVPYDAFALWLHRRACLYETAG